MFICETQTFLICNQTGVFFTKQQFLLEQTLFKITRFYHKIVYNA